MTLRTRTRRGPRSTRSRGPSGARPGCSFEVSQFAEDLKACVDFVACQGLQAFGPEALHGKRAHDAAVEQGPLPHFAAQVLLRRDVAHEATRERIARAGWVLHLLDGQGWRTEGMTSDAERSFAEENRRAILSVLDDQRLRSHGQNFLGC